MSQTTTKARWAIQVVFNNGGIAYLRHGSQVGAGRVVQFRARRDAEVNLDNMRIGLDGDVQSVNVVRYKVVGPFGPRLGRRSRAAESHELCQSALACGSLAALSWFVGCSCA
jgi:hypothetical protein